MLIEMHWNLTACSTPGREVTSAGRQAGRQQALGALWSVKHNARHPCCCVQLCVASTPVRQAFLFQRVCPVGADMRSPVSAYT